MTAKKWTPACEATLRALYPDTSNPEIARRMGRTEASIANRSVKLGLRKSEAFMASKPGVFKPGHRTWNRGKAMSEWMDPEAAKATQFHKGTLNGRAARLYRRVGSYRIADGQLQVKVTDDDSLRGNRRWQPVHRRVWEAANGTVPPGHLVVFKRGQHTVALEEVTLDRLECITRAENMRRNSFWENLPPEVAQLVQLRGALNRKINNRERSEK